ncbi:MAG: AsmA-like C-terminal region-containing protein [Caldiserica bacterium]|nr:AsmA-like C-terminal region-containing protein [Caldisericota bacterium]
MGVKVLLYLLFLIISFPLYPSWRTDFQIKGENMEVAPLLKLLPVFSRNQRWKIEGRVSPDLKISGDGEVLNIQGEVEYQDLSVTQTQGKFYLYSPSLSLKELRIERKEKKWKIDLVLTSPEIDYLGFSFKNVNALLTIEEGNLTLKSLTCVLGEGKIHVEGKIDLTDPKLPLDFKGKGEDIKLENISFHPGKGRLHVRFRIRGNGIDPASLNGWAKLEVKNAELGRLPVILEIFTLLFKGSSRVSLHSAKGDFKIREGFAYTDNLELKGRGVSVLAKGYVGWNRKLDFLIFFKMSQELLRFTPLTKLVGMVIDQLGNGLVRLRVTGTINNRQYTIVPFALGGDLGELFKKILGIDNN